jgi:hypothetical protein
MDMKQLLTNSWKIPTIFLWLFLLSSTGWLLIAIALIVITQSNRATENLSRIIREIRSPLQSNNSFDSNHTMIDKGQTRLDKNKESIINNIKGYRDQTRE